MATGNTGGFTSPPAFQVRGDTPQHLGTIGNLHNSESSYSNRFGTNKLQTAEQAKEKTESSDSEATHSTHKNSDEESPGASDWRDSEDSNEDNKSDDEKKQKSRNNRKKRKLFMKLTIARDDTESKESQERGMLAKLMSNTNDIAPNGLGGAQGSRPPPPHMLPGVIGGPIPPGVPPPHMPAISPLPPWRPPRQRPTGPPRVQFKTNKHAHWRQSLLNSRQISVDPASLDDSDVKKKGSPPHSRDMSKTEDGDSDSKTTFVQNHESQSNVPLPLDADKASLPPGAGLAESLSHIAGKHLGIDMLDRSSRAARFGSYLLDTIDMLEKEVSYLRASDEPVSSSSSSDSEAEVVQPPRSQTLHRIYCANSDHEHDQTVYEDEPKMTNDRFTGKMLSGKVKVQNLARYQLQHSSICFIVFKEHICAVVEKRQRERPIHQQTLSSKPSKRLERLMIVSPKLQKALEKVAEFQLYAEDTIGQFKEMDAPYSFLFHHRNKLANLEKDSDIYKPVLTPLRSFLEQNYEEEYQSAEALFRKGKVTQSHFAKLFKPNQMVISRASSAKLLAAHILTSIDFNQKEKYVLNGWSWQYNGSELSRKPWHDTMNQLSDEETAIADLDIHPVDFAREEAIKALEVRGRKFWSMREREFITYNGWDSNQDHFYVGARFIVDTSTYQKMFQKSYYRMLPKDREPSKFDSRPTSIHRENDLSKEQLMLLPPMTYGFNLNGKNWVEINVDTIEPVKWNKKAFDRLVLDIKTKELIYALIDVQTSRDMIMDDVIAGKGNGLIILLHGSPGTGKTLTAESVAEIAEKPLYRVTCGDIGTEAGDVEKYLKTVLYLGKIWDCVLLLDEADVFLEERTMADLQRNSLVSGKFLNKHSLLSIVHVNKSLLVFLRVLEYYEGILILTSNRVGTFDEAFKSRIQVAIHYDNLTKRSRKQIWQNFLEMIEESNEDANIPELERRLDELAAEEMNGRQIRNALLTARQLAKHRKERLDWPHLSQVMKTSAAFNKYLKEVRGHSDDQWARGESIR